MNNYYAGPEMNNEVKMEGMEVAGQNIDINADMNQNMMNMGCEPIYECPQERVCHKYINYEVPHIMPCNTKIIKHHVYCHKFIPCYSCCEENVVCNVYDNKPCCW